MSAGGPPPDAAVLGGRTTPVDVEGGRVVAESLGEGPVILLIHGWTLDRRMWTFQAHPFADRHFRVIAIDRRGCGQATAPPDPAREVDDLVAVLAAMQAQRCVVVGMSQGARVALALAHREPHLVAALVLQGVPSLGSAAADRAALPTQEMRSLAARGAFDAMRARWREHPIMAVRERGAAAIRDTMIDSYRGADLLLGAPQIALDARALAAIAVPSLILTGTQDTPDRAEAAASLAGMLPRGVTATVPGGHLCNLEAPRCYNRAALGFLEATARCAA